jgi:hypothetical protein
MQLNPAEINIDIAPIIEETVSPKKQRSLWRRGAVMLGLGVFAGCATSFVLPRIASSLPPTFMPLLMAPFLDGFSKSGKTFLKSLGSLKKKTLAVVTFLGGAAAWDYATAQDPTKIQNWGLTALVCATFAKYVANQVAGFQKTK